MEDKRLKHGGVSKNATYDYHRLYKRWESMKSRCNNHNNPMYKYYGGRGIEVCAAWNNSFENFKEWALNNGYDVCLSIDRINVNGNYEPNNCRWVDSKTQANNKRNNVRLTIGDETHTISEWADISHRPPFSIFYRLSTGKYSNYEAVFEDDVRLLYRKELTFNGETHSLLEWARITGLTQSVIRHRLDQNWDAEKILTTPMKDYKTIIVNGEEHSIYEWAKILGVTPRTIYERLKNGWLEQDAVTFPNGLYPDYIKGRSKKWSDNETEYLINAYRNQVSYKEIGKYLNRTPASVKGKIQTLKRDCKELFKNA